MSDWATKVQRSILVELWCFTLDQLHPRLGIHVASGLEVVVALGREETEEMLSATFGVFQVADGVEVIETDLFEETLLGGRFIEGEQVRAKDKVEGFPLLQAGALVKCKYRSGMGSKTLVFRVRLCTSPLRSTRSKAKLPSWLTGEKVSRLRCPLRTPEGLLDKAADAGADTGAGCLVSIGWGMAFGGVNKFLGFTDNTSVIFDVPTTAQAQARCRTEALLVEKVACGSGRE